MNSLPLTQLQYREVFHLEFLRRLGEKLSPDVFALKGGANLRLFFKSIRYSEDLDLDIAGSAAMRVDDLTGQSPNRPPSASIPRSVAPPDVGNLQKTVMAILSGKPFASTLETYGVHEIRPPDLERAKQTETTQRFKIHIVTAAGEDLFTKVEFSRRGFRGRPVADLVPESILRAYLMTPLWIPHYDLGSAIRQKIEALAGRAAVQARDIFDLFLLTSQTGPGLRQADLPAETRAILGMARDRVYDVDFIRFRDTVLDYLSDDDRASYDRPAAWDDLRLRVAGFLDRIANEPA